MSAEAERIGAARMDATMRLDGLGRQAAGLATDGGKTLARELVELGSAVQTATGDELSAALYTWAIEKWSPEQDAAVRGIQRHVVGTLDALRDALVGEVS